MVVAGQVSSRRRASMISAFPLLVIPVIIYFVIALAGGGGSSLDVNSAEGLWERGLYTFNMISGARWSISPGDIMIAFTLFLLFIEIIKATDTGAQSIVNHGLSMVLFVVCLVLFIIRPEAASSVFFFITVVTAIDVIAGFTITIVGARRDFTAPGVH